LNYESKNSDFLSNAGILAIIAASFSVTLGIVGIVTYQSYIAYVSVYGSLYGIDASSAIGYLLLSVFAFAASILGFAAALFSFTRKRFNLAVLGTLLMCASAVFTFIAVWQYGLGYSDGILVSGVPTLALALTSTILLVKSKNAFSDDNTLVETSQPPIVEERIDEAFKE
jgi:hypothetical protein